MANTVVGGNIKAPKKITLKDLNTASQDDQSTLSDIFPLNVDESAPVANLPSSVNMAAHAAVLSPDGTTADAMINSYRQALSEDTLEGQSQTATKLFQQATDSAMAANSNNLMGILADPNLSDEQKRAAANASYDRTNAMYSPQNLLSTKALSKPVGDTDNSETDNTRYSMAGVAIDMNNAKQQVQDVYNQAMTVNDPNIARKTASFLVGMFPLPLRTYMVAKMNADQSDDPIRSFFSTFLSGKGAAIQAMKDRVLQLPPDEQVAAASKLADIINDHSNILWVPDDSLRREVLQDTISGQGYNTPQKVTDNISSWIDTIIGAQAVKGVVGATKAAQAAREVGATDDFFKNWKFGFDKNYDSAKASQTASQTGKDLVPVVDTVQPELKKLPFNSYEKEPPRSEERRVGKECRS